MREITVNNQELKDLLLKRQVVFNESEELRKKIEDLQQEQVKYGYKIDKYKTKMTPIVNEEEKALNYTEFEYLSTVKLDGEEVKLVVRDRVEDYIEFIRDESKKKKDGVNNNTK